MSNKIIPFIFIGFGNSARRLAELLLEKKALITEKYQVSLSCVGISTAQHGIISSKSAIDLAQALALVRSGDALTSLPNTTILADSLTLIDRTPVSIVIETTPLNARDGEPALTHIMTALTQGKHVVTANKGPLAFAAQQLHSIAAHNGVLLRYESTVMDGMPIFNLYRHTLPLVEISGLVGILNSTTNFILTEMEAGGSFDAALKEAQSRGIAEANADLDIDGWDAAIKTSVLTNCLMNAILLPDQVKRTGIRALTSDQLITARQNNTKIRLVARVHKDLMGIQAQVTPELIPADSLLYNIDAFSSILLLETDLMGTIGLVEHQPDLTQTAYGLLSDLISIIEKIIGIQ